MDPQANRERSRRDAGLTALFLGFFGACWFAWGRSTAPTGLQQWLNAGGVVGLAVALAGVVIAFRDRGSPAALDDRYARRRYSITVGIEFGLAAVGAIALGLADQVEFIAAWVCAVVGVHFFPLARILRDRLLIPLGAALCLLAVAAVVTGLVTGTAPSTVAGTGAGVLLLIAALVGLLPTRPAPFSGTDTGPSWRGDQPPPAR